MARITPTARFPFLGWHPTKLYTRPHENGIQIDIYPKKKQDNLRIILTEDQAIQLINTIADTIENTEKGGDKM